MLYATKPPAGEWAGGAGHHPEHKQYHKLSTCKPSANSAEPKLYKVLRLSSGRQTHHTNRMIIKSYNNQYYHTMTRRII